MNGAGKLYNKIYQISYTENILCIDIYYRGLYADYRKFGLNVMSNDVFFN